ncbi:hypothetical protein J6590_074028 [Homalodisca vitripennis]|nr:hypothetical protein J6590_074028 [Homalodisca vitripennis]
MELYQASLSDYRLTTQKGLNHLKSNLAKVVRKKEQQQRTYWSQSKPTQPTTWCTGTELAILSPGAH